MAPPRQPVAKTLQRGTQNTAEGAVDPLMAELDEDATEFAAHWEAAEQQRLTASNVQNEILAEYKQFVREVKLPKGSSDDQIMEFAFPEDHAMFFSTVRKFISYVSKIEGPSSDLHGSTIRSRLEEICEAMQFWAERGYLDRGLPTANKEKLKYRTKEITELVLAKSGRRQ